MAEVIAGLDGSDGRMVFEAIRIAGAGGLGEVERLDVDTTPGDVDLLAAMDLAAERDSIARGYTDGLQAAFETGGAAVAGRVKTVWATKFGDRVGSCCLDGIGARQLDRSQMRH